MAPFPYIGGMTKLQALKEHLRPGQVYRREDLARWSNAVDRHLKQLLERWNAHEAGGWPLRLSEADRFRESPCGR